MVAQFRMTPDILSDAVWRQVFSEIEAEVPAMRASIQSVFAACEAIRGHMDVKTGSISTASATALYALVRHVKPRTVFEIGTYTGKSTLSMAKAMDAAGIDGTIFTCDGSNAFLVPVQETKAKIVGYPKTMSTEALRQVADTGAKIDFMHLDGRMNDEDMEIIAQIADPRVVVAIDDFEAAEKGVINFARMRKHPFFAKHVLVNPPRTTLCRELDFISTSTTAVMAPLTSFAFVAQPFW